ncbi:Hypothetical protein, putative [Bodo saltans]|uniref:Uncharacterized protein n=1 Tax=Bodo saltans TaxID=75058 RepID=A0A0S4JP39_BODSA|nr:Hypothetical protein, putative [Bodo saltans]|eukprot:CUG93330.1 Hypothetical protein, putative [Bodo saltans]
MRFFCFPFRCQQRSHESMFRLASCRLVAAMGVTSPFRLNPVIRRMRYVLPQQLAAVRFNSSTANSDDEFSFDSTELIQREAALTNLSSNTEKLLQQFLPPNAPESARSKVAKYLRDHPIDQLIVCPTVQVTHIEDEAGEEKKAGNLSPMSVKEAMEAAHARGFVVVQMGEANGKAFVRLRNEKKRILAIIAEDLAAAGSSVSDQAAEPEEQLRLKKSVDHIFRDVVDAHFISWKSKKIVEDLKKMHPVKVGIQQFQSAESAIAKLREMCVAMKGHAETGNVIHHFTSVNASDREIAVLFSPSAQGRENSAKSIKHPGEKEWNNALSRLQGQLRKSGRAGTYTKHDVLKARNLGAVTYRVDRFGRRMM